MLRSTVSAGKGRCRLPGDMSRRARVSWGLPVVASLLSLQSLGLPWWGGDTWLHPKALGATGRPKRGACPPSWSETSLVVSRTPNRERGAATSRGAAHSARPPRGTTCREKVAAAYTSSRGKRRLAQGMSPWADVWASGAAGSKRASRPWGFPAGLCFPQGKGGHGCRSPPSCHPQPSRHSAPKTPGSLCTDPRHLCGRPDFLRPWRRGWRDHSLQPCWDNMQQPEQRPSREEGGGRSQGPRAAHEWSSCWRPRPRPTQAQAPARPGPG